MKSDKKVKISKPVSSLFQKNVCMGFVVIRQNLVIAHVHFQNKLVNFN